MKKLLLLLTAVVVTVATQLNAQCTQCVPVSCSALHPSGGLCNSAPDDTAGVPYDAVVSFYAPKILNDPTTLAQCSGCNHIELHHITIVGIQGLPTGISATPNHANGFYDVWNNDTTGCVHFCGTPVAPGIYYVIVNLSADVVAVGTPIGNVTVNGQAQTYRDTIRIFPGTSVCPQSFSIGNGPCVLKACDSVQVNLNATLTNTHCANLISYKWNLGNGSTPSIKTPGIVNYTTPDTFPLTLVTTYYTYKIKNITANITGGYYPDIEELTSLQSPEPYVIIPSLGFNNTANAGSNVHSATWTNLGLVIPENNCADAVEIQVWDQDTGPPQHSNPLGSQDDNCDSHFITPAIPNQVQDVTSNSSVSVTFDTVATSSITETVNVIVYPHPPVPVLTASADSICANDSTTLTLLQPVPGYGFNWYRDTLELAPTDSFLVVKTSGNYKVKITNVVTGCVEWSAPHAIAVGQAAPATVSIIFNGAQEFVTPFPSSGFATDWYYNGNLVVGQQGKFLPYLGDGVYTAELYNISFPFCRTAADPDSVVSGINDMVDHSIYDVNIFPNPNNGKFKVNFTTNETQGIKIVVANAIGQKVAERKIENFNGTFNEEMDFTEANKGVYFITIETKNGRHNSKVVVQ